MLDFRDGLIEIDDVSHHYGRGFGRVGQGWR